MHGSFHLGAEETRELTELVTDINTAQIAIADRLARRGEQPPGDIQQLYYAFARLRALLGPGLEDADAERIEMNRPTNHAQMVKRVGQ
ncbi:MAG: hypothetical protein WCP28_17785 [Actinomycetes bacterium]